MFRTAKSRRRLVLWQVNPNCHWCGRLTRIIPDEERQTLGVSPNDEATLDHLITRLEKPRDKKRALHQTVLSCYECNQRRGHQAAVEFFPWWKEVKVRLCPELDAAYRDSALT